MWYIPRKPLVIMRLSIQFFAFLFSLNLLFPNEVVSQTNFYEDPRFPAIANAHEVIAVLPFDATVTLRPRQMKDMTSDQLERMEKAEGDGIQAAMYSWFLKRKKRGSLNIDVQSPNVTNAKLIKNGVTPETLAAYEPGELCAFLNKKSLPQREAFSLSEKRDSNSRPQPWQGCALPLSYSRILRFAFKPRTANLRKCNAGAKHVRKKS